MRRLSLISTMVLAMVAASPAIAQSGSARPGAGNWVGPLEIRFEGSAVAGRPIVALLPADGCVTNGGGEATIDPSRTLVSRNGNSVVLDVYSMLPVCFSVEPLGLWVYRQPLGIFDTGEYQVTVRFRYYDFGNGEPFATLTAPLAVAGSAAATALDARSGWSLGVLVLALAALGMAARRLRTP